MALDLDDLGPEPLEERDYLVGEKGFGTCKECGKKTMGKTNDLCSRCGGTPVHLLVGVEAPDGRALWKQRSWDRPRWGYHAPKKLNPPRCPKCHMEMQIIGGQSCPKCGKF